MADFQNQTITLAGRRMLATAIATKKQITFTKISCGDGNPPEAPEDLTALVNRIFDLGVAQVYKHANEEGTFVVSGSFVATSDKGTSTSGRRVFSPKLTETAKKSFSPTSTQGTSRTISPRSPPTP